MGRSWRYRIIAGAAAGIMVLNAAGCAKTDEKAGTAENAEETVITGNGDNISIRGQGAVAEGNLVTISGSGTYRLTGTVDDGRIVVDAGKEDEVRLVLDGFTITSSDFSAIYAIQSGLLTIAPEKGTDNTVSDGTAYQYGQNGGDEPDAAVFSRDDIVLEGEGSLTVHGNYQDGIRGKDGLTVKSGTYVIDAVNDGIKGRDSVDVEGGTITITAGGDGIQSNNDEDEDKGYVRVAGGTVSITAGKKGILAETLVEIDGGVIQAEAQDDAVHSDGDVMIKGGTLTLSSGDDAVHGDNHVEISGGDLVILKSYEGVEGLSIDITGGTIDIKSDDDGINAAGGTDGSGMEAREKEVGMRGSGRESAESGRPDSGGKNGDSPFGVTEGAYIRITGGTVKVNASGDGIDSNGDFFMEGGELRVEGPSDGGNGALDYDGTGTISGGTILVTGNAGMFQTFSDESSQPMLVVCYPERQSAGTQVAVKDGQGKIIAESVPSKDFEVLLFSCPQLENGETYKVVTGEETVDMVVDGIINQSGESAGRDRPVGVFGRGESGVRGESGANGENDVRGENGRSGSGVRGENGRGGNGGGKGGGAGDQAAPKGETGLETTSD